jgi:epoxyqueuosine reductase
MMLQALVKNRAREIGFDLVGIAPADAYEDLKFSREWVERGFGGEMGYLQNPKREDLRRILPSAQSVICVGMIYNAPLPYSVEMESRQEEVSPRGIADLNGGSRKAGAEGKKTSGRGGEIEAKQVEIQEPVRRPKSKASQLPRDGAHAPEANGHAWISRYAWGTDYHKIMRSKLEELRRAVKALAPGVETRVFVDTGPVVERAFARLAGIGWTGKNTCLINESKGSWFFLGVLITSLALEPDGAASDRCGTCTACLDACPTQALTEPYVMNATRCVAYLNIELKGAIPEEFRAAIGSNVVGCDICQDVCPWNGGSRETEVRIQNSGGARGKLGFGRRAATTTLPEFQPMQVNVEAGFAQAESQAPSSECMTFSLFNPTIESLASLSEEDFRTIFQKSPIKRVKYRGWLRNLCVVMGNSGESRFLPRLQHFREHPDPIVREHAEWAIQKIKRANPLPTEKHPSDVASSR